MIFPWSISKVIYIAILQTYCIEAQSMTPNNLPVDDKDAWVHPDWKQINLHTEQYYMSNSKQCMHKPPMSTIYEEHVYIINVNCPCVRKLGCICIGLGIDENGILLEQHSNHWDELLPTIWSNSYYSSILEIHTEVRDKNFFGNQISIDQCQTKDSVVVMAM